MIALLAGTRIGRWLAMIGAALALLAGAVFVGWSKRGQAEAQKALKSYKNTRKEIDSENYLGDDIGVIRDSLRDRGQR